MELMSIAFVITVADELLVEGDKKWKTTDKSEEIMIRMNNEMDQIIQTTPYFLKKNDTSSHTSLFWKVWRTKQSKVIQPIIY